jgi:hypothetical protein
MPHFIQRAAGKKAAALYHIDSAKKRIELKQ